MENKNDTVPSLTAIPPLKSVTIKPSPSRLITATHHVRGKPLWHIGESHTLTYCVSGLSVLHINGQYYLFRPGQLAFNPKGTPRGRTPLSEDLVLHEVSLAGDIDEDDIAEHLLLADGNYVVNLPQNHLPLARLCFEQALGSNISPEGYLFRTAASINLLGIYFDARLQMENSENTFSPVLAHMHEHLNTGVTLPELAALVHMQPTYFIRLFKKMFQQSPIAYYNTLRVVAAIELLSTTSLPLSEIAVKIGISDPYHFSNFFKNQCGVSPKQYRESIKGVKKMMEAER